MKGFVMSNDDPYRASQSGYAVPQNGRGMEYGRILSFVFESPNWLMNIVWGALCALLGSMVIGQLVMYGYQSQIMIDSVRNPNGQYPDFDSNKIGDYLIRGLWIWLGILIASILLGIVALALILFFGAILAVVGSLTAGANGEASVPMIIVLIVGYVTLFGTLTVLGFVVVAPVSIKVGLTGNLAEMFDFQWHIDFIQKTFGSLVMGALMMFLISILLSFCGMLLCFVGVFPAAGWIMLSQAQMFSQLYRTYLERGGRPVQIQLLGSSF
jgi:hypothetical protein